MGRIDICYETCRLETRTVAPTITGFHGIRICVKYLDSNPHKPIFYLFNYSDGSNVTILTWSGDQVE